MDLNCFFLYSSRVINYNIAIRVVFFFLLIGQETTASAACTCTLMCMARAIAAANDILLISGVALLYWHFPRLQSEE